jgi:choice-of-anchor C domain-containing protein
MRRSSVMLLAVLMLSAALAFASPLPLTNGSFELGGGGLDFSPGFVSDIGTAHPANTIPGWVVMSGNVDWISTYWNAQDGNRSLDMNGSTAGAIQQTFSSALTEGQAYKLTFWISANPELNPQDVKPIRFRIGNWNGSAWVSAVGQDAGVAQPKVETGVPKFTVEWTEVNYTFTAGAGYNTLYFESLYTAALPCGPTLDNVSLAAVPEPGLPILFGTLLLAMPFVRRLAKR